MKKLAIIGASELQEPLIRKAMSMGLETHVFAWKVNDIGERIADHFYPISITEKERILDRCRTIGIDGVCSIASDLAVTTVNYVAQMLKLPGNSVESALKSTNKYYMREMFKEYGNPSPQSKLIDENTNLDSLDLQFPVIIKPTDRSGSRGIFKLESREGLEQAVKAALVQGFEKKALVEEYIDGQEYSIESISYCGRHVFLAMTQKYTTGAPHFIETGHLQPAVIDNSVLSEVQQIVSNALNSLGIENGASHSELKINKDGDIKIIEIGSRMGGDYIGSDLVELSTGIDFLQTVIRIAIGEAPDLRQKHPPKAAAVRFVFSQNDLNVLQKLKDEHPEFLIRENVKVISNNRITDSSNRFGYYLMQAETREELAPYLPM